MAGLSSPTVMAVPPVGAGLALKRRPVRLFFMHARWQMFPGDTLIWITEKQFPDITEMTLSGRGPRLKNSARLQHSRLGNRPEEEPNRRFNSLGGGANRNSLARERHLFLLLLISKPQSRFDWGLLCLYVLGLRSRDSIIGAYFVWGRFLHHVVRYGERSGDGRRKRFQFC